MLIVAYTAVFGGFDKLKDTRFQATCITDEIQDAEGWLWYEIESPQPTPRLSNRYCKFFPWEFFPWADASIYFDGNIELLSHPREVIQKYLKNADIAVFEHPEGRDCIYQEAEAIIKHRKANPHSVRQYVQGLRKEGYPEHAGLAACYVLVRRHTRDMRVLSVKWWEMFMKGPKRDQLYFNYIFDEYDTLPGNLFKGASRDFKRSKHVRA